MVTGYTESSWFPTTSGAHDTTFNGFPCDAFVAHLDCRASAAARDDDTAAQARGATFEAVGPNPFTDSFAISYAIPRSERVCIQVFDVLGCLVRTLVDEKRPAGRGEADWNCRDEKGTRVPTGVYWNRSAAGGDIRSTRVILARPHP